MNLSALHNQEMEVSMVGLFQGQTGKALVMQLKENGHLKEHASEIPAMLICVSGMVIYQEEDRKVTLHPGLCKY